jgi:hypothetical protein
VDGGLWTLDCGRVGAFLRAMRILARKPTDEGNRCDLEPVTPKTGEKALSLVSLARRLPLYVVYFGLTRFALPNPLPRLGGNAFPMRSPVANEALILWQGLKRSDE